MPPGAVIPPEPDGHEYVTVAGQPSRLATAPGDVGTQTEWDASTLEGAINWLETHSTYLSQSLVPGMETDIRNWLTGSGTSPFGTYPTALQLGDRQLGHYTTADASIRAIARELWQAAQALRVVLEQYETAEQANELSAAAFDQIFVEQSGTRPGGGSPPDPAASPSPAPAPVASPLDPSLPAPGAPVVSSAGVAPAVHVTDTAPYGG
ncbi:hypothetical protein [Catenuloplanes indicus]|uniref:Uncharacterized protein n=1 Tax=Catenuloplanes indicus TaxID=137267 RepID=A0AAE3VYI1_9ACTN|nr:hypothetical protein [Catenuloplanes indicus]MDQ0366201.1 hypothetical protein [Catenuloplanes indicus]